LQQTSYEEQFLTSLQDYTIFGSESSKTATKQHAGSANHEFIGIEVESFSGETESARPKMRLKID
jgi:hypothetical protein